MHDTIMPNGNPQRMVDVHGIPKGLKQVLVERGVNVTGMVRKDYVKELSQHRDFKEERSAVYTYLHNVMHYHCLVLPKVSIIISVVRKMLLSLFLQHLHVQFHPELNPIERCWATAKQYARAHCDYRFPSLQRVTSRALDSITLEEVRKHFRKVRDYHRAYMAGKNALEAETQVMDDK